MSGSRVAVIMAVRDGAPYLADAIDSVLEQTRRPDHVIVIDDGSTDATPTILAHYGARVRVERRPAAGYAAALNRGLSLASSEFVAFHDADDLWMPDKLRLQLDTFRERPELDAVAGHVEQFLTPGVAASGRRFKFDPGPLPGRTLPCLLLRRSLVDRIGPLDETVGTAAAVDWIARLSPLTTMAMLTPVVLRRRIHGENTTITTADERDHALLQVVRGHRRRARQTGRE